MDRDYQVGDTLLLREYDPLSQSYTGRKCRVCVTYITSARHQHCAFSPTALHPATAVLSVKLIGES